MSAYALSKENRETSRQCPARAGACSPWAVEATVSRHSPSLRTQSEQCSKVFHLGRGQGLGESVGHHVVCGTVDEADGALLDDPADPIVAGEARAIAYTSKHMHKFSGARPKA